jgi:hypothetical protein
MIYLLAAAYVALSLAAAALIAGVIHLADDRAPHAETPEYEAAA